MKILITGSAGDLGQALVDDLESHHTLFCLDVKEPSRRQTNFTRGSVLDRKLLGELLGDVDCVVHIAGWHGIHEFYESKDAFDFWDLNATGTFNVLEASQRAGVAKLVYMSSTSILDFPGVYAHSKAIGEDLARVYAARSGMDIISLRPRAFTPWTNNVWKGYAEWAQWFLRGAVHISDVVQAVRKCVERDGNPGHIALTLDGAYEYTANELNTWDSRGPGSTFVKRFGSDSFKLAVDSGLDPTVRPEILGFGKARETIGYDPRYGISQLLVDLRRRRDATQ
ncbi:NAD(P)-dependent oxidoreductase [Streptomyces sp. NBC_00233]|uniref:NAD-dependent epimerase/dehydratase family protein n=1 Tax=Streptomyces sp. NBC_00233 TaxID=2975686 RepID=UPI00224F5ECB|nr:NAD(P)-dependent oxidoreductase [Streptomyces sp. NBC_00233]MCX5233300.1 NAD(P)-dependent oxidoreductase [Streptomyces sp. NBC_00233]